MRGERNTLARTAGALLLGLLLGAPAAQADLPPGRLYVRALIFEGNTVLSAQEVEAVAAAFVEREIESDELEDLRLALTRLYTDKGFVNSGVVIPDQDPADGVVRLRAVEGRVTDIQVDGEELRIAPDFLVARLQRATGPVLNVNRLREALELLQENGLFSRINAEIVPGLEPGEARLRLHVVETRQRRALISANNHRNPAVGELRAEMLAEHLNLTGSADRLEVRAGATEGLKDYSIAYARPLNALDTAVAAQFSRSDVRVVDPDLRDLDIANDSETLALGVEQPLLRKPGTSLAVSLMRERRESRTAILGVPFNFTPGIPAEGAKASVWRAAANWLRRAPTRVVGARLQLSRGKTNAQAPRTFPEAPDASFSHWIGQLHFGQRFASTGSQFLARLEMQHTRDVLLPIERFGLGGANTVRGFRENRLLRDRGWLLSAEYRHPLLGPHAQSLLAAAFLDHGSSQNVSGAADAPRSITGTGVGLLWEPVAKARVQLYAARASTRLQVARKGLQDRGVHLLVSYELD